MKSIFLFCCTAFFLFSCAHSKHAAVGQVEELYQGYIIYYINNQNYSPCGTYLEYAVFCKTWENVERIIYNRAFYTESFQYSELSIRLENIGKLLVSSDDYRICPALDSLDSKQDSSAVGFHRTSSPFKEVGTITNTFFMIDKVSFKGKPGSEVVSCGELINTRNYNLNNIVIYEENGVLSLIPNVIIYPISKIHSCTPCVPSY